MNTPPINRFFRLKAKRVSTSVIASAQRDKNHICYLIVNRGQLACAIWETTKISSSVDKLSRWRTEPRCTACIGIFDDMRTWLRIFGV